LLLRRLLSALGLARKSGEITSGFERVIAAIRAGKAALLIEAIDGAADGTAQAGLGDPPGWRFRRPSSASSPGKN